MSIIGVTHTFFPIFLLSYKKRKGKQEFSMALTSKQLNEIIAKELGNRLDREFMISAVEKSTGIKDGALAHDLMQMARNGKYRPIIELLLETGSIQQSSDGYVWNL